MKEIIYCDRCLKRLCEHEIFTSVNPPFRGEAAETELYKYCYACFVYVEDGEEIDDDDDDD